MKLLKQILNSLKNKSNIYYIFIYTWLNKNEVHLNDMIKQHQEVKGLASVKFLMGSNTKHMASFTRYSCSWTL